MKKGISVLLVLCTLMSVVLTGCGKPTVNLNDYVVVTEYGYDGYGEISVEVDFRKLVRDHADKLTDKNLDASVLGVKTPETAAIFILEAQVPYLLDYEDRENLKNGDKIEFSWQTGEAAVKALKKVLAVNIECEAFTYTVKNLEALREVDPFENLDITTYGFSGQGKISEIRSRINVDDEELEFILDYDDSRNGEWANGDTITCAMDDAEDEEYLAETFGIKLSRKTADIELNALNYYPTENPREIFEYFSEEDLNNVTEAVKSKYKDYAGEIAVEYVGSMYYYMDPVDFDESEPAKMFFVYHITNGIEPDGWYTYMTPTWPAGFNVFLNVEQDENGNTVKKTVFGTQNLDQGEFPTGSGNYGTDQINRYATTSGPATYFTYEGLYYAGHQTIRECVDAIDDRYISNVTSWLGEKIEKPYNHLVVTEGLQNVVTEY